MMVTTRRFLIGAVPLATFCATLALTAGTASASVDVVTAANQQTLQINASGDIQRVLRLERHARRDPGELYHAMDKLAAKLSRAARVVSHASVDSARQRAGRRAWVSATRDFSDSYYRLGHAFHLIATHRAGPKVARLILAAESEGRRALRNGHRADRLLGVRSFS